MALFIPCIWLLLLLLCLLLIEVKRGNKQHLPGPRKLPVIGNLHQLGALPHRSLSHLSKKYGPVMFLQLGSTPTVVISSAEAARQAMKVHDLDCCTRPPLAGPRRLSYNHLDVSFSPYGHHWREMRKISVLQLFSAKKLQEFQHVREEEVDSFVSSIARSSSSGTPIDFTESFSLTASVVFKAAFGKTYEGTEFSNRRLQEVVDEALVVLGEFPASDFFPYVGCIIDRLTGLHTKLEKSFHELDIFFQHLIDYHLNRDRSKQEQEEDIVDVLLRVEREQHELGSVQFSKDHIKAILMDVFLAAVSTGAITIIWAMAELAKNPRIMVKAQHEVRRCIGKKGKVTENDIDMLKYLKMIVKETLRFHPPAPLLLPREALSHFKLNGYNVYPKTRIMINAWAIARDPAHWKNPEEFFPERFADNSIDYKGQNFEFIPFGAGRRICPGMTMATTLVELALANLLYSFDWKLPTGMKESDIDMEEAPGLTVPKKTALHLIPSRASSRFRSPPYAQNSPSPIATKTLATRNLDPSPSSPPPELYYFFLS